LNLRRQLAGGLTKIGVFDLEYLISRAQALLLETLAPHGAEADEHRQDQHAKGAEDEQADAH
jgi:hypothetical protein